MEANGVDGVNRNAGKQRTVFFFASHSASAYVDRLRRIVHVNDDDVS